MILIADCSALVALSVCDALEILDQLYQEVYVPLSVYREATVFGKNQATQLRDYLLSKVVQMDCSLPSTNSSELVVGEFDAMALYDAMQADFLLVDDKHARKIAKERNIHVVGSLGVLQIAVTRGIISQIQPYLNKLRNSHLFFSDSLLQNVFGNQP